MAVEHYLQPGGVDGDNVVDVSTYGEVDFGPVYAGLAALKSTDTPADEVSLGFGYRGEVAGMPYDIGYTHYFYPKDTAAEFGELVLSVEKGFGDRVTATFDLGYDVINKAANGNLEAEFEATETLALSANFGLNQVPGADNQTEWDIGTTHAMTDEVEFDLRYFNNSDNTDGYAGLALYWDTSKLLK